MKKEKEVVDFLMKLNSEQQRWWFETTSSWWNCPHVKKWLSLIVERFMRKIKEWKEVIHRLLFKLKKHTAQYDEDAVATGGKNNNVKVSKPKSEAL